MTGTRKNGKREGSRSARALQEVQQLIDKNRWQMPAHFQATPTDRNTGADIGASHKGAARRTAMAGHGADRA